MDVCDPIPVIVKCPVCSNILRFSNEELYLGRDEILCERCAESIDLSLHAFPESEGIEDGESDDQSGFIANDLMFDAGFSQSVSSYQEILNPATAIERQIAMQPTVKPRQPMFSEKKSKLVPFIIKYAVLIAFSMLVIFCLYQVQGFVPLLDSFKLKMGL